MADSPEQLDLEVPRPLAEALAGAYGHRATVPERVDDAVISAARRRFDRRRRLKLWVRWGGAVAATAAAAVIAVVVWLSPARREQPTLQVKGDVDGSGVVDIVDAMALARHVKAGDAAQNGWDVNGDAKLDQRDVDALAAAAVSLKQQGLAERRRLPSMDELGLSRVPNVKIDPARRDVAMAVVQREGAQ